MTLQELLVMRGLNSKKAKLVRHQDPRWDVHAMYRADCLEEYQAYQSTKRFEGCDFIVSFLGDRGSDSVFVGVYEVLGVTAKVPKYSDAFPYPEMKSAANFFYELRKLEGFEDLEDRLVIDWGKSTRSWHQWIRHEKTVVEIRRRGFVRPFPGFLELVLDHHELVSISNHPAASGDWHRALRSVAGIYLILDKATGNQYVGSAYGKEGILGRWKSYARTGHGGNKELRGLDPDNFQYSILQTLPMTCTPKEVIEYEGTYKEKLGSRAFGLNSN